MPPRGGVHPDVLLVLGGDLVREPVPVQDPLVEPVDRVDEGHGPKMQARLGDRGPDRPAEARDDRLLPLGHREERALQEDGQQDQSEQSYVEALVFHWAAPFFWVSKRGRRPCTPLSTMVTCWKRL